MTTIEVLQLLVEALELAMYQQVKQKDAIIAGRAEIERLEKCEPVAWNGGKAGSEWTTDRAVAESWLTTSNQQAVPLYTNPAPASVTSSEPYCWMNDTVEPIGTTPVSFTYQPKWGFTFPLYTAPAIPEGWQKDAERYRYLRHASRRECLSRDGPEAGCWIDCEDENHRLILLTEEDADNAIDAAMAIREMITPS